MVVSYCYAILSSISLSCNAFSPGCEILKRLQWTITRLVIMITWMRRHPQEMTSHIFIFNSKTNSVGEPVSIINALELFDIGTHLHWFIQ